MENRTVRGMSLTWGIALVLVALAADAPARTLRTITIDGNLDDWTEVLLDPSQIVSDRSLAQGDPDMPGQSQRDLRGVAVTWDATNLYLYFSRTGSGTNSFNAIFYLDTGHDGLLGATDRIVFFKFAGSSFNGADLVVYAPLSPGGDPIPGDGVTPDGSKGAILPAGAVSGAGDVPGIRFEVSLPWSSFTATPELPINVRAALSANQNLPAGVEDNAGPIDTFLPGVRVSAGRTRGAAPGRSTTFPHRVTNAGTGTDTLDLATNSLLGFSVELFSDPDGDGDLADGALAAADTNGDGDYTDAADTPPGALWDTNNDGLPDGGSLAVDASRDWVLRVTVPTYQELGSEDTVRLSATSDYDTSVRKLVNDFVQVGLVTVTPPGSTVATSNLLARFPHEICNGSGADRTLDLTGTSPAGWTVVIETDPDGDGDPADGLPLSDSDGDTVPDIGLLPDGACATFVVSVSIPPGTPGGTLEEISVVAADGSLTALALDVIDAVDSRVVLEPDRSATGQRGKTLYLTHELANAANEVDSFALSSAAVLGSLTTVLDDPDGDGRPADSSPVVNSGPVAANGGQYPLISRVRLPDTVVHGDVETVTLQATSDASAEFETVLETIDIAGLLTYSDPLFARPANEFYGQCSVVYALAFQSAGTYIFNWLDPLNVAQRTSPSLSPYADGSLDDFFDAGPNPMQGIWTVQLLRRSGSNWISLGPEGTRTFEVINLIDAGAGVATVNTGADIYDQFGEDFVGFSEVANPSQADVLGSTVSYVVFFDSDLDGRPTAGEDWLQPDGLVAPWSLGDLTAQRTGIDVVAGETWADRFDIPNAQFSRIGGWTLLASWEASCGFLVSELTAPFTVGCEPAPAFGGLVDAVDVDVCANDGVLLTWNPVVNWGVGTGGTYAVWRSEVPGFTPSPATLLASGLPGPTFVDFTAVPDTTYYYLVQAESDVTCSNGPNNNGLLDGNLIRHSASDGDAGVIPVASFSHSSPECWDRVAGLVSFQDLSIGPPTAWSWDFDGDGLEDSTDPAPTFDYPGPGSYQVSLTVTNPCGQDTVVSPVIVTEAPVAAISADRTQSCLGETIDFDGSGSAASAPATIVAWSWDFDGDGLEDASDEDPAPFAHGAEGSFTATLTVTDSEGCTDTASLPVVVHPELAMSLAVDAVVSCVGEVTAHASGSGGLPPYAYSWDVLTDDGAGNGSGTFAFGSAFTVTATVTDAAGCSVQETSPLVVLPPELTVSVGAPVVDPCTGDVSVSAQAMGGYGSYSYSWDVLSDDGAGNGSATLPFGSGGSATVTVIDANGCTVEATSASWVLPDELTGDFAPVVTYVGPGVFEATASAAVGGGFGVLSLEWDLDDDGTVDGTATDFIATLGPGETRPLRLTVTDENGCSVSVLHDLVSGGCPVDVPLTGLRVRKGAGGAGLVLTWDVSSHPCHGRYRVVEAADSRPATRPGTWPSDPLWSDLQAEDADGSELDEQLVLLDARDGESRYFLVRDGGTDGTFAPTLHYGNDSVGP